MGTVLHTPAINFVPNRCNWKLDGFLRCLSCKNTVMCLSWHRMNIWMSRKAINSWGNQMNELELELINECTVSTSELGSETDWKSQREREGERGGGGGLKGKLQNQASVSAPLLQFSSLHLVQYSTFSFVLFNCSGKQIPLLLQTSLRLHFKTRHIETKLSTLLVGKETWNPYFHKVIFLLILKNLILQYGTEHIGN
jgi:hypothetical protein